MQFTLNITPPTATAQEKGVSVRGGKPHHYEKKEVKAARAILEAALAPHIPAQPMTGPIRLVTEWRFPRGKSHKDGEWRITRPDTDNLVKGLKDCMTRLGFWDDDSRVCCELISKTWSDNPGITIRVDEIGGDCRVYLGTD